MRNMEAACRKMLCVGTSANGRLAISESLRGSPGVRFMINTRSLRAKSTRPAKTSQKKSQRAPLEYKTPTRKSPPSSETLPPPRVNPLKHRTIPIVFGSILLFGISGYCAYVYVALTRVDSDAAPTTPSTQADVSNRYDTIASTFDSSVSSTEKFMGIDSLRRKLVSQAHGDVLEVSIGTGRNLQYYDWDFKGFGGVGKVDGSGGIKRGKIRSFTAVDKSEEMLEIAHEKFGRLFPGILGVRWVVGDAAERGTIPGLPRSSNERSGNLDRKYDTVVQTMGLCSVSDPVALLRNLGEHVKEDGGRILLLEHGRGRWEWLNTLLDKSAEGHAREFGCWWNRDMEGIVKECGLDVVKIETPKWWHGGTTWWIELKRPKSTLYATEVVGPEASRRQE